LQFLYSFHQSFLVVTSILQHVFTIYSAFQFRNYWLHYYNTPYLTGIEICQEKRAITFVLWCFGVLVHSMVKDLMDGWINIKVFFSGSYVPVYVIECIKAVMQGHQQAFDQRLNLRAVSRRKFLF